MSKLDLSVDGMTCAACVRRVETVLKKVPGVTDARVNLALRQASVDYADQEQAQALEPLLIAAIEKAGFSAEVIDPDSERLSIQEKSAAEIAALKREFSIAAILTLPVFVMAMGTHLIPGFHHWLNNLMSDQTQNVLQAVLTTAVLIWPGRVFFTHGLKALLKGQPEMNSLVAVGAGSAWVYSMVVLLAPHLLPETARHVYFEAAAVIVTLILLGRLFESRARGKTGAAIERLIGLQPRQARLLDTSVVPPIESDVAIESVKPGDVLRVRPGEKIPVDGQIIEGEPFVDQSMITGEPIPVSLAPGDTVAAGTLNTTVGFVFKATHTGSDTVLAHIIRLVQSAQSAKLPIQASVDKVTAVFVPIIMAIALLTFAVWLWSTGDISQSLVSAVAVLIIACPCAMGLATPTSIMVGTGRAAQLGVLFRQGDALQTLKSTNIVAFDKTGTLTEGHPKLTEFELLPGTESLWGKDEVLGLVASLQQQSEHPIARAIVLAAQSLGNHRLISTQTLSFQAIKGFGIRARVLTPTGQELDVAVGSEALADDLGVDTSVSRETIERWASTGQTPIHVIIDQRLVALMAVSDPIKPDARVTINALQQQGIDCAMITGDHPLTAKAVAKDLGIHLVRAQVKPEDKVAAIEEFRREKKTTSGTCVLAFVGDGINDAPALASADVGIAIGTGTDVAIESASVVLMSGELSKVATAIELSRATLTNIHQNLFWAFAYNAVLVPVAAGVLYPLNGMLLSPMLAAGAMAFSSLFVVSNALRLRFFKPKPL